MPAMSPTMTEGGITGWKKAEGESFAAGDVLLEVVRLSSKRSAEMEGQQEDKRVANLEFSAGYRTARGEES
jgi:hypothetical protein